MQGFEAFLIIYVTKHTVQLGLNHIFNEKRLFYV